MLEAFWTSPPSDAAGQRDPIGMRSVQERAADVLLPGITGRTRQVDEYLWALVGLRWAGNGTRTDREVWERFERFEKALKVSWYLRGSRAFSGFRRVRAHVNAGGKDLAFVLLANQRAQGLLGSYLQSLRFARLVRDDSLALTETGRRLIEPTHFGWSGEAARYGAMEKHFPPRAFSPSQRRALGKNLFESDGMRATATTIARLGSSTRWSAASSALKGDQRAIARVGNAIGRLSSQATKTFWHLLKAEKGALPRVRVHGLSGSAWRDVIFARSMAMYRTCFDSFFASVERRPKPALLALHWSVWKQREHLFPWIDHRERVRGDIKARTPPEDHEPELRWPVCHQLIRQCEWAP